MPVASITDEFRDRQLLIAFFLPDLGGGGAERVVVNLVNFYVRKGIPITLILARAQGELLCRLDDRVTVIDLAVRHKALAVWALARYLRRARPDCLVSHMDIANVAACSAQRLSGDAAGRLILCCHLMFSKQLEAIRRPKDRVVAMLMRRLYPKADGLIAVSNGVAQDIADLTGLPVNRFDVIHNPAYDEAIPDLAMADPQHPWLSPGENEVPVVVTAGRLTYEKDFTMLLAAIHRVNQCRPVRLIILGSGPLEETLRRQAEELDIAEVVDFAGFQANPFAFISRANVFALSSRWEGFGNVIVEAMACGTPVVSTDCPAGPSEILDNGQYGTLIRVGDASKMANALLKSIGENRDQNALRKRARFFSIEKAAASYLSAIKAYKA